ncbi:MAG: hypothetical protein K6U00_02315 [Armatimonadetes bacterium]|nr:hypothetical protein [Armatimonadota bacterium]
MNNVIFENPIEREAIRYLEDQAYEALLGYKEPVRSAEIVGAIGKDLYSSKLIRHVLAASDRFYQIDRRWDLNARYEDKQKPVERILTRIIQNYGRPMTVQQVANELASVYERPTDYYETVAARMLENKTRYFHISGGLYGLREWLLEITSSDEEDIIFDNDLDTSEIETLEKTAAKVNWTSSDIVAVVTKFIDLAKTPVPNKLVDFFLWRAVGDVLDPVEVFDKLYHSKELVWFSDTRWAVQNMVDEYDRILVEMADHLAEEIIEEAPQTVVEKAEVTEEVAPTLSLTISERDLDEVAQIVSATGEARMPTILETIFEISPREPIYAVAAEGLAEAMRADPRFTWVGTDRWRMTEGIPAHVKEVPPELVIPRLYFETLEGEPMEVELEDEGLEGGLDKEIHNPLVQDVGDQDPITELDELPPMDSVRCVLKRHHKLLGTFPLCQVPKTFFPLGPHLLELTLTDGEKRSDIWVNRDTGIMYDMGDWYMADTPDSGAVFELVKTDKPDEFQFIYEGKTDPFAFLSSGRVQELLKLAEDPATEKMSTFELLIKLMETHRKGVPFITLFTEINIVRRTTRRLVASILSSYYAFYQKPNSALWLFDEKKVDQGFKKAKRKYIRREQ